MVARSITLDVLQSALRSEGADARGWRLRLTFLKADGACAARFKPGPPYQETRISGRGRGYQTGGTERASVSPRVRVAPVTYAWTCVLLRPIVARVIKIFEPMNIRESRGGDSARRRLSPMNIDDSPPKVDEPRPSRDSLRDSRFRPYR